ncbi:MAG: hypothetical protein ACR2JF_13330 [Iamia sp.]
MRIRRTLVTMTAAVLSVVVLGVGPVAAGGDDSPPDVDDVGNSLVASDSTTGVPLGSEPPAGSTGSGGGEPPPGYVVDTFEGLEPEGNPEVRDRCWGIRIGEEGEGFLRETYAEAQAELAALGDPDYLGQCAATETFDLVDYVNQSWRSVVRPPPPSPLRVAPGKAVTGLRTYLEIGGEAAPTTTLDNPIGPDVVITMAPRYVVTWGDGTSVETDSQGVPWPGGSGEITHVYTDAADLTLEVRAYWTGTWSAGGAGGTLPELPAPTQAALDLPVEEYQVTTD